MSDSQKTRRWALGLLGSGAASVIAYTLIKPTDPKKPPEVAIDKKSESAEDLNSALDQDAKLPPSEVRIQLDNNTAQVIINSRFVSLSPFIANFEEYLPTQPNIKNTSDIRLDLTLGEKTTIAASLSLADLRKLNKIPERADSKLKVHLFESDRSGFAFIGNDLYINTGCFKHMTVDYAVTAISEQARKRKAQQEKGSSVIGRAETKSGPIQI